MEPFDTIEKWINEHGSAAILREHVALLKSQMEAKDAKIKELSFETENLKRLNKDANYRINNIQAQQPADTCPFCRRQTGELQRIEAIPGLELHGISKGHYKCSNANCGKTYEKQVKG